jgi:hypothetical protein
MLEEIRFVAPKPHLVAVDVPALSVQEQYPHEIRRWVVLLGLPMLGACVFIALAIGTSLEWLYGGAVVLGPGAGVGVIVYLAMSSDTNGARGRFAAVTSRPANLHAAAAQIA